MGKLSSLWGTAQRPRACSASSRSLCCRSYHAEDSGIEGPRAYGCFFFFFAGPFLHSSNDQGLGFRVYRP